MKDPLKFTVFMLLISVIFTFLGTFVFISVSLVYNKYKLYLAIPTGFIGTFLSLFLFFLSCDKIMKWLRM